MVQQLISQVFNCHKLKLKTFVLRVEIDHNGKDGGCTFYQNITE